MSIDSIKNELPDYAKDIKLNLVTILNETGSPDLSAKQIYSIALASACATRNVDLMIALTNHAEEQLSAAEIQAAKAAATIMAMNNIYYRYTHVMTDQSYSHMPAKLRMNILANPGADKITFELSCLAVSALNGCGMCMNAHTALLEKNGVSKLGIQSAVRIASVINATALAMEINV
jgi:alkyl hydroperoxide reductase subunit D